MEQKKSRHADIDRLRGWFFLAGLVLATSCLVGALWLRLPEDNYTMDPSALDELMEELQLDEEEKEKDEFIALMPEKEEPKVADEIELVDEKETEEDNPFEPQQAVTLAEVEEQTPADEPIAPMAVDEDNNPLNFRVVEQLPEFPGGMVEFMKWLNSHLRYPALAQQKKESGKVVLSFIIDTDGKVCDAKILNKVPASLEREALRIVRLMPQWKPGEQMGKPCRTMFTIPIMFTL